MDAPVYRHTDARAMLLGLNFPGDFLAVVVLGYLWLVVPPPAGFLLAVRRHAHGHRILSHGKATLVRTTRGAL